VRLTTAAPGEPNVSVVYPESAELSSYGLPEPVWAEKDRPLTNIPNGKGIPQIQTFTSGNFTKYGDVKQLIKESNNKFCIMQKGDGISFTFALPNLTGEAQSYFLNSDLAYKPQICPGVLAPIPYLRTVEPLPNRRDGIYPPSADVIEQNPEMKSYQSEWNTRFYEPYQRIESLLPM